MSDRQAVETLFEAHTFTDYRWIDPKEIVVAQWVRMKCTFGCSSYGSSASCPPNTPSVAECRRFFDEYTTAAVFHFEKAVDDPEDRKPWSKKLSRALLKLEREVFVSGHQKAFMLVADSCRLCTECPGGREACRHPEFARPSPEAMAVDVFSTVRKIGYPIQVLSDYHQPMNRYAILLVE